MEIRNTISIDRLTTESVSVKEQKVLTDGDSEYTLGEPVRTAYTKEDREMLKADLPDPYLSAVLEVWGMTDDEQ